MNCQSVPLDPENEKELPDGELSGAPAGPDNAGSNSGAGSEDKRKPYFNLLSFLAPLNVQDGVPATKLLIILNVAVFVLMVLDSSIMTVLTPTNELLIEWGANIGPLSLGPEPWRISTLCFVHIGGLHLLLNMVVLWQFGVPVEKLYGTRFYLLLYLLSGLAGSCVSLLLTPVLVSAGASGAIYGVIGGLIACYVRKRKDIQPQVMKAVGQFVLVLVGATLAMGFVYPIDNAAHFGGMAAGFLSGLFFFPDRTNIFYKLRFVGALLVSAMIFGVYKYAQAVPFDFNGDFAALSHEQELKLKTPRESLDLADQFIERNPDKSFGYRAKGELLRVLSKNREAIGYFNKALGIDPEDAALYMGRSKCYLHAGMYEAAIKDVEKAKELGVSGPAPYYVLMMSAGATGKYPLALQSCRKLLKLSGDSYYNFLVDRSRIYRMMGRQNDALNDLNTVVKENRHPSVVRALESRAYLYYELDRVENALQDQKRVGKYKGFNSEYEYLNRAYASLIFDSADVALADSRALLKKFSYDHTKSEALTYGAIIGVLAAKSLDDSGALKELDAGIGKLVEKDFWPYPIIGYIKGGVSEKDLLGALEKNKSRLTEARAFIGFNKEIEGRTEEAKADYNWVLDKGNKFFMEYDLAMVRLKMLKNK